MNETFLENVYEAATEKNKNNRIFGNESTISYIIEDVLERSSFSPKLLGYSYIKQAVLMCSQNSELLVGKTKVLYTSIAKINNVQISSVERNIRNAISSAWKNNYGNNFYIRVNCFYMPFKKRPTCGDIIDILTRYVDRRAF